MPHLSLTKEIVDSIPLTAVGQVIYRDTKLIGFGLRVGTRTKAYFAEKRVEGRNVRTTLGLHGQVTPAEARSKAQKALGTMAGGVDMNALERAKVEQRRSQADYTLGKLCAWYIDHQKKLGKSSWVDAENIFKNHVKTDALAALPARAVTPKQITVLVRRLVEAGKGRTAAKLRSYLRAAYALAMGAETNAHAPADLVLFGIESNPVAATAALASFNNPRRVVATEALLGKSLRLLRDRRSTEFDAALAVVELGLILGGQRPQQVLRVRRSDVDMEAAIVTVMDPKGRRSIPRRHTLPLMKDGAALMREILKNCKGEQLFSIAGEPVSYTAVSAKTRELLADAHAALVKEMGRNKGAGQVPAQIQVRDLRRTAETMMASMGISKDLRAQLLSHGLGGVQDRHYDQHHYLPEKRKALRAWEARLDELATGEAPASNVKKLLNRAAR